MAEVNTAPEKPKKKGFSIPLYFVAIGAFVAIFASFVAVTVLFKQPTGGFIPASGLSKQEVELFVKDLNPMQISTLAQNKKQLTDELRNVMAVAREAHREGVTSKPEVQRELEYIERAITATNYDQALTSGEDTPGVPRQPFGDVTEEQVEDYWSGKGEEGVTKESREQEFKEFIDGKIALQKATGQMPEDQPTPSEEELKPIKDNYARTIITFRAAEKKYASIPSMKGDEKKKWDEVKRKSDLQVKLQQSQFLAAYYAQTDLNDKVEPTEEEIKKYLADNPELGNEEEKKKKADEVIAKLNSGGDFAELAKEFSEDPGSKENGGLYEDVTMGRMTPVFEKAALALEPGSYTKEPVKTNFGYHVIKLESVTDGKDEEGKPSKTYNVRHILISTQISDPNNPFSPPVSAEDYVKSKLAEEKEKEVLDAILARNPIGMPADYDLPKVEQPPTPQFPMGPGQMPPGAAPPQPQGPPPPPPSSQPPASN